MKVKELLNKLKQMNENADICVISENGTYLDIYDCEEENSELVSIGLK